MKASVLLDRSNVDKKNPCQLTLMVSLQAPEVPEDKRTPTDLVLVLDISGSMSESVVPGTESRTKLQCVQEAATRLVEQLKDADSLAVIAFDDRIEKVLDMGWANETCRDAAKRRIARLVPRNSTDLALATVRGIEILKQVPPNPSRSRRVILFTDGIATAGVTSHAGILNAVMQAAGDKNPVTTIGFGQTVGTGSGGYNPEVLSSIANATGGNFYHAEGESGTLEAFAKELGSLRAIAATDVCVDLTLESGLTLAAVLNEFRGDHGSDHVTAKLVSMYGGETQHVLFLLAVPSVKKNFPRPVKAGAVTVTALLADGNSFTWEGAASFRYTAPSKATKNPNQLVEEEAVRLLAARRTKEAYTLAAAGDHLKAGQVIDDILARARTLKSEKGQQLVKSLEAVRQIVASSQEFHRGSGNVFATSHSLGSGRASGSTITDRGTQTLYQSRTLADMGAPDPDPATGTKPDKK